MEGWGSTQYQTQTKRSMSLVPWENGAKLRHEAQYLPSYTCSRDARRLPDLKENDIKAGMWPNDCARDAQIAHLSWSCSVAIHNPCLHPLVRSGHSKGGALLVELSPLCEGQPTRWPHLQHNKGLKCQYGCDAGKPLYLLSLSHLALLLQSLTVCSVITRRPVYCV